MTKDAAVSVSGIRSEKFSPGELTEIRIVPSSNGGAEVYCSYAPTKKEMKAGMNFYIPPKPATFTSKDEAIEHARKELIGEK